MSRSLFKAAAAGFMLISLTLSGCGGESESPKAKATPSEKETTVSATPTPPKVSEETICDLLFSGDDQPMNDAADMVGKFANDPNATGVDSAKAAELATSLRSIAARAPESLAPHLIAEADFMERLNEMAETGAVNFETFKSSGIEISNVCVPLL